MVRGIITANGGDIVGITVFTDEEWFHLSSYVPIQNSWVLSVI
jgi:hypothetical protein